MPPHMRDGRPRSRGPEDDMPPHMRDRRPPRGPEDDMPPHMRDRRPPRGPEDDMPPHMRDRRPGYGPERPPRMGERRPPRGPDDGMTPRMREGRPGYGPERTPQMGERRPERRERRMSRSCSPRRPRPPHNSEPFRNSPIISPRQQMSSPRQQSGSPKSEYSSLGRDPTGMNMHKPMNAYRSPHSTSSSPVTSMISPDGRQNSLNRNMNHGINNIERKLSSNSSPRNMNGHRRNGSLSSSFSGNSSGDRSLKSGLRISQNSSIMEASKTPLIVNHVENLRVHSTEIKTVNEYGEIAAPGDVSSTNNSLVESSQIIDFNELLNSLDSTLQDNSTKFNTHSNPSTPPRSRKNSDLEKLRSQRKTKFEDMEKILDDSILYTKNKSRSNISVDKTINHHSSHFDDSQLKNILEELTTTSTSVGKPNHNAPMTTSNSYPNLNERNDRGEPPVLNNTEDTIKGLQGQLDGLAVQTKQVLL